MVRNGPQHMPMPYHVDSILFHRKFVPAVVRRVAAVTAEARPCAERPVPRMALSAAARPLPTTQRCRSGDAGGSRPKSVIGCPIRSVAVRALRSLSHDDSLLSSGHRSRQPQGHEAVSFMHHANQRAVRVCGARALPARPTRPNRRGGSQGRRGCRRRLTILPTVLLGCSSYQRAILAIPGTRCRTGLLSCR
jgi:hypothetical protein